jgi:hypothetical protein
VLERQAVLVALVLVQTWVVLVVLVVLVGQSLSAFHAL